MFFFKARRTCVEQKKQGREVEATGRNLKVNLRRLLKAQENPRKVLVPSLGGGQLEALRGFQASATELAAGTIKTTEIAAATMTPWAADSYSIVSRCRLLWLALDMHDLI